MGVKYDLLLEAPPTNRAHIEHMARCFADAMDAPLVLCSPAVPINVASIFKVKSSNALRCSQDQIILSHTSSAQDAWLRLY